jgi:hypothetical protein
VAEASIASTGLFDAFSGRICETTPHQRLVRVSQGGVGADPMLDFGRSRFSGDFSLSAALAGSLPYVTGGAAGGACVLGNAPAVDAMYQSKRARSACQVFRLGLFLAFALAGFLSLVAVTALVVSGWQGSDTLTAEGLSLGVVCGLIAWLFVVVFHINRETILMPFDSAAVFLKRVRAQLEEMGYRVSAPSENVLVGKPTFYALLFGGHVVVRLGERQAVVIGPKIYLERLRKGCRVSQHLEHTHQSLSRVRRRPGESLCERVVDRQIRDRLKEQQVVAEVRKVSLPGAAAGA